MNRRKRLLAVDVGNTSITCGLFEGHRLSARWQFSTDPIKNKSVKALSLQFFKGHSLDSGFDVLISSVVPAVMPVLTRMLRFVSGTRPQVVGKDLQVPVINRYRVPAQVGPDRLVNAWAAWSLYQGPAIVVDFGTALTIDCVSAKREYLGGLIVPGVQLALEALTDRAALLPKLRLAPPKELLGRDTVSSVRSGIIYGHAALCDGIIRQIRRQFRGRVVATGGQAGLITPYSKTIRKVDPDLTLRGLYLLSNLSSHL